MWTAALVLMVGVPLLAALGVTHDFLWFALIWAALMISMYISVFPHELGHALMAYAVGYRPLAIVWGEPNAASRYRILGVRLLIGRTPYGGLTFFEPVEARFARLRWMAITAAGAATNLLIGWCTLKLALIIEAPYQESIGKSALLIFAAANGIMAFVNLWPAHMVTPVGRFPNDGLKLIKLLMGSPLSLQQGRIAACQVRIYLANADGEAEKILADADLAEKLSGPAPWIDVARSAAFCQLDRPAEARSLLQPLLDSNNTEPGVRGLAANNLAWTLFLLDDPVHDAACLEHSALAMETLPWHPAVVATRASTLAVRASPGSARAQEARGLLDILAGMPMEVRSRSVVAVARGLLAVVDGDFDAARAHLRAARGLFDPGMAGRVLESRLPNP